MSPYPIHIYIIDINHLHCHQFIAHFHPFISHFVPLSFIRLSICLYHTRHFRPFPFRSIFYTFHICIVLLISSYTFSHHFATTFITCSLWLQYHILLSQPSLATSFDLENCLFSRGLWKRIIYIFYLSLMFIDISGIFFYSYVN